MTAGYLVDSLTGMPWEEAVRKRIFEPLRMIELELLGQGFAEDG